MFAVDLHAHTRFFHAFRGTSTAYDPIGVRLLARFARWRDLDGVALTNHDYYRGFDLNQDSLEFIPGIEISTTEGHVLVIGPDPPTQTEPGSLTPQDAVALARDRGCAAVIAHPYRHSTVRTNPSTFDAVEINGKAPGNYGRIRSLAEERALPVTGGSDAHYPFEIGRAYTQIDCDELTPRSIVRAIRDGRVNAKVTEGLSQRILWNAYKYIHRMKGHVSSPTDE